MKPRVSFRGSVCVIALKANQPTCAHVCQNHIQAAVVVVQAAGLVVAVGPFALDQERPRHGSCAPPQTFCCLQTRLRPEVPSD